MIGTAPKPVVEPLLIDVVVVSALLACSQRHVYRLDEAGRMPKSRKIGALVRWSKAEIERWVAAGCPSDAPDDAKDDAGFAGRIKITGSIAGEAK